MAQMRTVITRIPSGRYKLDILDAHSGGWEITFSPDGEKTFATEEAARLAGEAFIRMMEQDPVCRRLTPQPVQGGLPW